MLCVYIMYYGLWFAFSIWYSLTYTHSLDQQYPGMYPPSTQPTHPPHPPHPPTSSVHSSVVAATALGAAAATISAEEEERHFKESERIKRQSLETAVADKIRRQVKQVLDSAQVGINASTYVYIYRVCTSNKMLFRCL